MGLELLKNNEPKMHSTPSPQNDYLRRGTYAFAAVILGTFALVSGSLAQVHIERNGQSVTIDNGHGSKSVKATKAVGGWIVTDSDGSTYEACTCPSGQWQTTSGTWVCKDYQSSDGVAPEIIAGYADALEYMAVNYGAVVEHDDVLDVDYVSFPDAEDPYALLVEILLNDFVNDRPIVDYFKNVEPSTFGSTGDTYGSANPKGKNSSCPNDPYYSSQWNLQAINLDRALLNPLTSNLDRPVRIGIVDSGINSEDLSHPGLDGASLFNQTPELSTGFALQHGLAVTTLLADAGNDANGPVGLAGSWKGISKAAFTRHPSEIYLYNAGDFGPVTTLVARGIAAAIDDGVDVINLNLRSAYSFAIEEQIQRAIDSGIIIVAAAGNFAPNQKVKVTAFPARLDGVISVASSNKGSGLSVFSADLDYDVVAPGEDIVIGAPGATWTFGSGTSFAAPHVAATAALMKMANPGLTSPDVEAILIGTANLKKGKGNPLVDALAALDAATAGGAGKNAVQLASEIEQPTLLTLGNYPNPFNPSTNIVFELPAAASVTLTVFDALGRQVASRSSAYDSGRHVLPFSGENLAAGVYHYRIEVDGKSKMASMLLLK